MVLESAGSLMVTLKISGKKLFQPFTVYITAYAINTTEFPATGNNYCVKHDECTCISLRMIDFLQ